MAGEASWAITLPNQFEPYGNILQRGINMQNEQNQMLYSEKIREQQRKEQDEWKKLNLIQDLTNLDKHQTGSDVANTIGQKLTADIVQKYTAEAASMSPSELQAKISKDMSGIISSMDALKTELNISDEQLKALKVTYPGLDIARLAKDSRADILNRRLKGTGFTNPLEVSQSTISYDNPEFLASYMVGNKALSDEIINAKGAEPETVLMGKQGDYTKFEGKLPYWKKPSYDRNKFNSEGFYTDKAIPSLQLKEGTLTGVSKLSPNGQPLKIIDSDVYKRVSDDKTMNLELISATRKAFPDYDNFNPEEKEYAKRNVLHGIISSLDQSQLHPTQNVRPPVTRVNIGRQPTKAEILAATPLNLNNYPKEGEEYVITKLAPGIKVTGLPDGKTLAATKIKFNPDTKEVTYTDVMNNTVTEDFETFRQNIATINTGVDLSFIDRLKVTPRPVVSGGGSQSSTYTINGQNYSKDELLKAGWDEDKIQKAINAGKMKKN